MSEVTVRWPLVRTDDDEQGILQRSKAHGIMIDNFGGFFSRSYISRAISSVTRPLLFYVRAIRCTLPNSPRWIQSDNSNFALTKTCDEDGQLATPICLCLLCCALKCRLQIHVRPIQCFC